MSPLSNAYVALDAAHRMEPFYPLHAFVCDACFLVQLAEFESPQEIFGDYAYFSSYSSSWLAHAEAYAVAMRARLGLGRASRVVEVASNDGYLLQYFRDAGVPVLGIEPAANVAAVAVARGISTRVEFFGTGAASALAREDLAADLLIGNNVLAHVPDINDFVAGLALALKPHGVVTLEFPHLLRLIEGGQFDTIYHEHFSYLSLATTERILARHGLVVFDVEELPTHGGSLRVFARHAADTERVVAPSVAALKRVESAGGLARVAAYEAFGEKARAAKRALVRFLIDAKSQGRSIVGYGAPAKGNTLLNFCGIGRDFLDYTVDRSPHKQGRLLPGSRIPVLAPETIAATRPDYVLILPWNLRDEIAAQLDYVRAWGGRLVVPIPQVEVLA